MMKSHNGAGLEKGDPSLRAIATEILTVPEVAVRLRVPASWVYSHADLLGALRLGKYLRFEWPRVLERLTSSTGGRCSLGPQPNDLGRTQ